METNLSSQNRVVSIPHFSQRLQIGRGFEEKVSRFLTSLGFPIGLHFSKEKQWEFGESAAHVEVKLDNGWQKTGNLFIEVRERRSSDGTSQWRSTGIDDETDPWFYCIGDEHKLWLLGVRWLKNIHNSKRYREVVNSSDTSYGILIRCELADAFAIRIWENWIAVA